jgi:GT2 family glycosyltransferase
MKNRIAAIIPTFRRDKYLIDTINYLLEQTRRPDEIVVIDQTDENERTDVHRKELQEMAKLSTVTIVRQKDAHVYQARNRAAYTAHSEILLYLDDDIVPHKDLVKTHAEKYKDQNVEAVVGSIVKNFEDKMRDMPEKFPEMPPEKQAFLYRENWSKSIEKVGFMYAGNFSIRKKILADAGGWDEHIITYGDRELGIRLAKNGKRIDYEPKAKIVHLAAPTGGTRLSQEKVTWNSWQRCISVHLLAWRYLGKRPFMFAKYGLWRSARMSFLLKKNVQDPRTWTSEVLGWTKGLIKGRRWAKEGIKCTFDLKKNNKKDCK